MRVILLVHVLAGGLGIVFGFVALYAAKGARLHRKAGMLFVCAMLTMALGGVVIAAGWRVTPGINIPAGLITIYLVVTSLTTVRPPAAGSRWLTPSLMLVALGVGLTSLTFGFEALANGGTRDGIPAFPFFLFGIIGLLASAGDLRVIRSGVLRGTQRLARHLWRMSFALWIAAMSFFIGQADEFPEALRITALLAVPVLAPLLTMLYWLWRVRIRRNVQGIVGVSAPEATAVGAD